MRGERVLFTRVQPSAHERVERAARADGLTTSQFVRHAVGAHLQRRELSRSHGATSGTLPGLASAVAAFAELEGPA